MKTLHLVVLSTYRNKKIINLIPGDNFPWDMSDLIPYSD
nr:MAG TPA: hypothetical protein [Bacteriophage sp.]